MRRAGARAFTTYSEYEGFYTKRCKARKPSPIRSLQPLVNLPGMISLGGGMPNPSTFPLASLKIECTNGEHLLLASTALEKGLQYSPSPGLPELTSLLMEMQIAEHQPPPHDVIKRSLTVTQGSQDGLTKAFDMLLDSDDSLLLESPTYPGSLAYLQPIGCKLVELACDAHGLNPTELASVMDNWDESTQGRRPRVLYTIPTGSNPTGVSLSLERKKEIYGIASKYNLIILEDDPYYYLRLDGERKDHPSFLQLDTEQRVLRFDSLSKVLSSGMRLGFATGPECLIEKINLHTQASNVHPSGLSQAVVLSILKDWGPVGWEKHVQAVCDFYRAQREAFLHAAEKELAGLAEWNHPDAGMFVWMKLNGVCDTERLIKEKAVDNKVLLVPGNAFLPHARPSPYVRAAYSTASPQDMATALSRLANLLRHK